MLEDIQGIEVGITEDNKNICPCDSCDIECLDYESCCDYCRWLSDGKALCDRIPIEKITYNDCEDSIEKSKQRAISKNSKK